MRLKLIQLWPDNETSACGFLLCPFTSFPAHFFDRTEVLIEVLAFNLNRNLEMKGNGGWSSNTGLSPFEGISPMGECFVSFISTFQMADSTASESVLKPRRSYLLKNKDPAERGLFKLAQKTPVLFHNQRQEGIEVGQ